MYPYFPYEFVSEDTLLYKGNTPDSEFYKNKLSLDEYKAIFSYTWDIKY